MAYRAILSDSEASKEEATESFIPIVLPKRAAVGGVKQSVAANPQVGTFGASGHSMSYRQALASVRMNAAEGDSAAGEDSMKDLAAAAMDSAGDPGKIAENLENMKDEDKQKVETLKMSVLEKAKSLPGVTAPLGFFDPLGFCADCTEGTLCFYREVELKHGRVGMLASVGFLVGEQFHPLFGGDIDVPSYLAFQQTPLQTFWPAVVAAIAIPEIFSVFSFQSPAGNEPWSMRTDRRPGDFGFDPLGIRPEDPKELNEMQTKELNNGRLAMIATAGMIAQEIASGQKLF